MGRQAMLLNDQLSLLQLANPIRALRSFYNCRDLIRQIVVRNIQMRYKGSILGLVWVVATPLLMIVIYTFVFSVVFKARWGAASGVEETKMAFALILFLWPGGL
jgi:lipopolysaccharide transport system permease protein